MAEFATSRGLQDWAELLPMIGARVALLHAICGFLVPLMVVSVMTRFFGERRSFADGLRVWRFALFASLAMTVPYVLIARLLGPEFPSLLGSLVGLAIVVPAAKRGFLLPDEPAWQFPAESSWGEDWRGTVEVDLKQDHGRIALWQAWLPYVLMAVLLVLSRLPKPLDQVKKLLQSFTIPRSAETIPELLGDTVEIAPVAILYLPGTIFVVASLCAVGLHRMDVAAVRRAWHRSFQMVVSASVALVFAVPMVQVFLNSGGGAAEFDSMPNMLAGSVSSLTGGSWPAFAPLIGGLGAFVAGSNTISNMTFSSFQFTVAEQIGADPLWVVALQAVGGAAGNVICVHNVVFACAVVGLVGKEGDVIRITAFAFVYYILVAAVLGMFLA